MNKKFYSILFFIIAFNLMSPIWGQYKSLINYYFNQIDYFKYTDYSKIYSYAKNAYQISEATKDTFYMGRAAKELGAYYIFRGKQDSALYYSDLAFKLSEHAKDSLNLSRVANNLGVIYQNLANYDSAYKYFSCSYNINIALNNDAELLTDFNNLGMLFYLQNKYLEAINYFSRFLKMALDLNDSIRISEAYCNLALTFNQIDNYDYALNLLQKGLNYSVNNDYIKVKILDNLGITYTYLENFNKSKFYLDSSYRLKIKNNFLTELIQSHLYYAEYFANTAEYDSLESHLADAIQLCFNTKNYRLAYTTLTIYGNYFKDIKIYDKALAYFLNAEEIANNANAYKYLENIYQNIADIYSSLGDFKNAYEYEKKLTNLLLGNDSINYAKPFIAQNIEQVNQATTLKKLNLTYILFISGILLASATLLFINYYIKRKNKMKE
ncbi:MAG: tetratricopeptide repeat protein [Bacteroidales bacterium]|nr:tetratricopeptide repeat protein [Bacteroidales bacterium]